MIVYRIRGSIDGCFGLVFINHKIPFMTRSHFLRIYKEKSPLGIGILIRKLGRVSLLPDERRAILADLDNLYQERCLTKIKANRMRTKEQVVAAIRRQALDVFAEWSRKHAREQVQRKEYGRLHKTDAQESDLGNVELKDYVEYIRKRLPKKDFDLWRLRGLEGQPFNLLAKILKKRPEALRQQYGRVQIEIRKFFSRMSIFHL